MEKEIIENYLQIQEKLDSFITNENHHNINKIKKMCDTVYNDFLKNYQNGLVKKSKIDCFNWYEIFIKILEYDKNISLNSKFYILSGCKKIAYKIISKPIEYINKTLDCDFDPDFCILDWTDEFVNDAKSRDYFPYKEDITQLCMVFTGMPSETLIKEIKNKNVIPIAMHDLKFLDSIKKELETVNIDINIIMSLCSDINDLKPESNLITEAITEGYFLGFDIEITKNFTNAQFCAFIKKEKDKITDEIKKYKRAIMCQSAYDNSKRLLNRNGTKSEINKLDMIVKDFNIIIIDENQYDCDLIEENIKKIYNKVERDVIKIGYIFNAKTLTSNYRYVNFLMMRNIYIEAEIIPSLNLICKMGKQ